MGTTLPSQVRDPASLPVGTEVDEWRVVSWSGRGTYGTVYRVERRGHEAQGPYALKLALHARKEQEKKPARASSQPPHVHSRPRDLRWLALVVPGLAMLVLMVGPRGKHSPEQPANEPAVASAEKLDAGTADAGTAGAAEEILTAASVHPMTRSAWGAVAVGIPKEPWPGQRKPPCPPGEEAIRGGCWRPIPEMETPCETGYYEWGRRCYLPIFAQSRPPTSEPR
jgi:hypothetical protein